MNDQILDFFAASYFQNSKLRIELRERFIYYVIALCVGSTGFAVAFTISQKFSYLLILVWAAMICWMICAFIGLRLLIMLQSKLIKESEGMNLSLPPKGSEYPLIHEEQKMELIKRIKEISAKISEEHSLQLGFMMFGFILFIGWYIATIFLN
jgi:hypothetical protein